MKDHPKFVRWALMLGIVIVLNVFFAVLVSLALPAPDYEAYCPSTRVVEAYDTEASCLAVGGQWNESYPYEKPQVTPQPAGYCDAQFTCREEFTAASEDHARDAFIAYVVLGVLALAAGLAPIGAAIVSSGLSYGGVVTLVVGSAQYWGSADNWIRLAISTAALLALIYLGWRNFKD